MTNPVTPPLDTVTESVDDLAASILALAKTAERLQEKVGVVSAEQASIAALQLSVREEASIARRRSILLTIVVAVILAVGATYAVDTTIAGNERRIALLTECEARNAQSNVVAKFIAKVKAGVEANPVIPQSVKDDQINTYNELLAGFPSVDCMAL